MLPVAKIGFCCGAAILVAASRVNKKRRNQSGTDYQPPNVGSRRRGRREKRALRGMKPCATSYPEGRVVLRAQEVPPMPWLSDDVNQSMLRSLQAGVRDTSTLTNNALREVYSHSTEGEALNWPCVNGDCPEKLALESRAALRAERILAEQRDIDADDLWVRNGGY